MLTAHRLHPLIALLPPLLLLVAVAGSARAACSTAQTGSLTGQPGVHTETLPPGRSTFSFTIPPVCWQQSGVRVAACETAAEEDGDGDGSAPAVRVDGRHVSVTRSVAAADNGFGVVTVELYCADADEQNLEK